MAKQTSVINIVELLQKTDLYLPSITYLFQKSQLRLVL